MSAQIDIFDEIIVDNFAGGGGGPGKLPRVVHRYYREYGTVS